MELNWLTMICAISHEKKKIVMIMCHIITKGVPYAVNPPVRFAPPQPVAPWSGVWNATYFRPACAQLSTFLSSEVDEWSEDCLYVNVFVTNPMVSRVPFFLSFFLIAR